MVEPKYRALIEWNASVNLMLSNLASVTPSKSDQIYLNVSIGIQVSRFLNLSHYTLNTHMYLREALCVDESFSFACLCWFIRFLSLSRLSRVATLGLGWYGSMLLLLGVLDADVESDVTSLLQSDRKQRKYSLGSTDVNISFSMHFIQATLLFERRDDIQDKQSQLARRFF